MKMNGSKIVNFVFLKKKIISTSMWGVTFMITNNVFTKYFFVVSDLTKFLKQSVGSGQSVQEIYNHLIITPKIKSQRLFLK